MEENGIPYSVLIKHFRQNFIELFLILDEVDDFDGENEAEPEADSLANMLNNGAEDDYYGYDDVY